LIESDADVAVRRLSELGASAKQIQEYLKLKFRIENLETIKENMAYLYDVDSLHRRWDRFQLLIAKIFAPFEGKENLIAKLKIDYEWAYKPGRTAEEIKNRMESVSKLLMKYYDDSLRKQEQLNELEAKGAGKSAPAQSLREHIKGLKDIITFHEVELGIYEKVFIKLKEIERAREALKGKGEKTEIKTTFKVDTKEAGVTIQQLKTKLKNLKDQLATAPIGSQLFENLVLKIKQVNAQLEKIENMRNKVGQKKISINADVKPLQLVFSSTKQSIDGLFFNLSLLKKELQEVANQIISVNVDSTSLEALQREYKLLQSQIIALQSQIKLQPVNIPNVNVGIESKLGEFISAEQRNNLFEGENGFVAAVQTSMETAKGFVHGFFSDLYISQERANSLLEKGFIGMANAFISAVEQMIAKWLAFQALKLTLSAIGLPLPIGMSGGGVITGGRKFASGGAFIVPQGFSNDTYPILVESGERIDITPASEVSILR